MSEEEGGEPKKEKKSKKKQRRDPKQVKRELHLIDRELTDLTRLRWKYSKRMLKFGIAAWLVGVGAFVVALVIYGGIDLIMNAPLLSIVLVIAAVAAPMVITVVMIRKFSKSMAHLEQIRKQ